MELTERYNRNMMTLTPEENERLHSFSVCVVGCGGLGGYSIELLGRLGIGHITTVDGDVFDPTNLNRQLLSSEVQLGQKKALAAKERMSLVNSDVEIKPICEFLREENCEDIIKDHDVIIDALDNMGARKILERHCERLNLPMIHGAIAGWYGQVATIMPGDRLLERIYAVEEEKGIETELGNPSFTPALVAALQVSEAIKLLLNKGERLQGKMLHIDLLNHEYDVSSIG